MMIEYKGYLGTFEFDKETALFQGRVSNIEDLISFQGKSIKEIEQDFQNAIDGYIKWCEKYRRGREKASWKERTIEDIEKQEDP